MSDILTRNLSWGADCEGCEERMNASRAEMAAREADETGLLLCGACRDEARWGAERDELQGRIDKALALLDRPEVAYILSARQIEQAVGALRGDEAS